MTCKKNSNYISIAFICANPRQMKFRSQDE